GGGDFSISFCVGGEGSAVGHVGEGAFVIGDAGTDFVGGKTVDGLVAFADERAGVVVAKFGDDHWIGIEFGGEDGFSGAADIAGPYVLTGPERALETEDEFISWADGFVDGVGTANGLEVVSIPGGIAAAGGMGRFIGLEAVRDIFCVGIGGR